MPSRPAGASRRYIFATVWLSMALMLTIGSLLGLVLGYAAAFGLSRVFASQTAIALPVALSGPEFLLVLAIIVIGLALATIPAALGYHGSVSAGLRS